MLDFTITHLTFSLVLLFAVLYYTLVIAGHDTIYKGTDYDWGRYAVGVFVLSVCSWLDLDFFHYKELVSQYDFTPDAHNHGEAIYGFIVSLVGKNYLLFRVVIWGSAMVLFIYTTKRLKISIKCSLFFLLTCYIQVFSYARASLAMAIYFFGISFLIAPAKNRFVSYVSALIIIICSYFFHSSMLVIILLTPVVFLPLNKKTYAALILLSPILFVSMKTLFFKVIEGSLTIDNYVMGRIVGYANADGGVDANWKGMIQAMMMYSTYYVPYLITTNAIVRRKNNVPNHLTKLFMLITFIIIVSICFFFMGFQSKVFAYRVLFMSYMGLAWLMVGLLQNRCISAKEFKISLFIGVIYETIIILFNFYRLA